MNLRALSITALAALSVSPGLAEAEDAFKLEKGREVLAPITHGSLSLLPIVAEKPDTKTNYIVLDEGMKSKKVKISEVSTEGEVNELLISNNSNQPLFLMSGEVIIGGKQDRIIGKTMVVPPKTVQKVGVFCVEQGRWNGRKASFKTTGALAHKSLRNKASFKNQSEVWKEVKSKNGKRKVDNGTDTYRKVATGKSVKESVKGFEKHYGRALKKLASKNRSNHVGYVVALNGKVVSIEVFGSAKLFKKLEDKLLRSYFVEAVDVVKAKNAKKVSATSISKFRKKARAAKAKRVVKGEGVAEAAADTYQFEGDGVKGSVVKPRDAAAAEPAVYEGNFD